jgi:hypothetical protein
MSVLAGSIRDMLSGARVGLVATGAMSLLMLAGRRLGLTGTLPPRRVTDRAVEELEPGDRPSHDDRQLLAGFGHFAFGAGAGALFGLLTAGLRSLRISTGLGIAYGTVVYLISYAGWIPALDIMPRPSRDRPGRVVTMVGAHWVYGAMLGLLVALARRRRRLAEQARRRFAA